MTPEGRDVLPPLAFQIDWSVVGIISGGLAGVFVLNLSVVLLLLGRLNTPLALRGNA